MKLFLLSCLFFLASPEINNKEATDQAGTVIKIVDGDTFDLLTADQATLRVRMYGIDCPEKKQDFYQSAKNALAAYIFKKNVQLKITGHDRNRRTIAMVYCNGQNINLAMIKNGFAWHFSKYSSDINFAQAESQARKAKAGLWKKPGPIAPWEFRKQRQQVSQNLFSDPWM
ncbi:thermonuclease family protein [Terrimonas pollutisoli]|uniref:thermonuclease family protein n=1 Tax=Terrimonas pollutisoli TaxID=3034147 RepID=UPI0023EBC879|nr:thermonuclease family protein [Terrimonas sp. H1YJ31]